jgi:hypothetical protein
MEKVDDWEKHKQTREKKTQVEAKNNEGPSWKRLTTDERERDGETERPF